MQTAQLVKKFVVVLWLALAAFTAITTIGTPFYFLGEMPRSPHLGTGRIYPVTTASNTRVYVH
jgi:hypothetical protein